MRISLDTGGMSQISNVDVLKLLGGLEPGVKRFVQRSAKFEATFAADLNFVVQELRAVQEICTEAIRTRTVGQAKIAVDPAQTRLAAAQNRLCHDAKRLVESAFTNHKDGWRTLLKHDAWDEFQVASDKAPKANNLGDLLTAVTVMSTRAATLHDELQRLRELENS